MSQSVSKHNSVKQNTIAVQAYARICSIMLFLLTIATFKINAEPALPSMTLLGDDFYYYVSTENESLYSISRRYGIPYEELIKWNNSSDNDISKGQYVFYPKASTAAVSDDLQIRTIVYTVKFGDTLYSLASRFNTSIAEIFVQNPTLTPEILKAGENIKIMENSNVASYTPIMVEKDKVVQFKTYTAKKGDSLDGIAASHGLDASLVKNANPGVTQVKKNTKIAIPVINHYREAVMGYNRDPRESSFDGVCGIYDEVCAARAPKEKNVVVLLANYKSKRDVDFTRGFLTAMDMIKDRKYDVNLTFVDAASSIVGNTDVANADVIITTCDKDFSKYASYRKSGREIYNVFDVKDVTYQTADGVMNMLQTSDTFNESVINYLLERYGNDKFIFLGDPLNADDAIGLGLMNRLHIDQFEVVENLTDATPAYGKDVIIYCLASKKDAVKADLKAIATYRGDNIYESVKVIGRPSWIVFEETMSAELHEAGVFIPSRFYYDSDSYAAKGFVAKYKSLFSGTPVKSYPVYAAMGYDVANFILNNDIYTPLQIRFNTESVYGGGDYNSSVYMIQFKESGDTRAFLVDEE